MTCGSPRKQNPLPDHFFVSTTVIVWLRQTVGQQSAVAIDYLAQPFPLAGACQIIQSPCCIFDLFSMHRLATV